LSTEYRFNKKTGRLEGDVPRQNQPPSLGRRIAGTGAGLAWVSVSAVIGTRVFWFLYLNLGPFLASAESIWNELSPESLGFSFLGSSTLNPLAVQLFTIGISTMVFLSLSAATPIVLKWSCRRHFSYLIEGSWGISCAGLGAEVFHMLSQLEVEFLGGQLNMLEASLLSLLTALSAFCAGHLIIEQLRE